MKKKSIINLIRYHSEGSDSAYQMRWVSRFIMVF